MTSFLLPDINRINLTTDERTGYLENPTYKKNNYKLSVLQAMSPNNGNQ